MKIEQCITHKGKVFIVGQGIQIWTVTGEFLMGRLSHIYTSCKEIELDCSKNYKSIEKSIHLEDITNIESFIIKEEK